MNQLLCFAPELLHVSPWADEVVDKLGFDPRSSYVEDFWLGILGPSTVWLLRRFAAGFDYSPSGFDLDLAETARSIGISDRSNRNAPFVRAINRTVQFGLARLTGPDSLAVRRRIPPLTRRHLRHLSPALRELHAAWQEAHGFSTASWQVARTRAVPPAASTAANAIAAGEGPVTGDVGEAAASTGGAATLAPLASEVGPRRP
jgi:hypothetical protein